MIISELPQIQNIDEVHIYYNNKLVKEICIANTTLLSQQIKKHLVPFYFYRDIDYMTVCCEGVFATVMVLEIMLK